MSLCTVKIAMCGESACGKSAVLMALASLSGYSKTHLYPTIDDTFQKVHVLGKRHFLLDLLDLSGMFEYEAFRRQQYRDADVFILCYAVNDRSSFNALASWVEEIRSISKTSPFIIVSCKSDLRGVASTTTAEALQRAAELGASHFVECSAWTGEGIQYVAEKAIELSTRSTERGGRVRSLYITTGSEKRKKERGKGFFSSCKGKKSLPHVLTELSEDTRKKKPRETLKPKLTSVSLSSCMPIFRRTSEPQWTYSTTDSSDTLSFESSSSESEKYFSFMTLDKEFFSS